MLLLLSLGLSGPARADYYIVVNEANPVTGLTKRDVLNLFMGRSRSFPQHGAAMAYEIGDDTRRAGFYGVLGGMSLPQVTSYWARLMFSGRSLPPEKVADEHAVLQKVQSDPRAIGWVTAPPTQKGVRTVLVLKDAP